MTITHAGADAAEQQHVKTGAAHCRRSELTVLAQQIAAIEAFNRSMRLAEQADRAVGRSREMRMDAARRMDVLRRQQQAIIAHTQAQLQSTGKRLAAHAAGRAVVAHRNEWFLRNVATTLRGLGMHVVAQLENGADTMGVALCEQPDLVLVEDTLAMVPGEHVLRELRQRCPETVLVAQCPYGDRVGALLDAGARAVFTRNVPPAEVAIGAHALLV